MQHTFLPRAAASLVLLGAAIAGHAADFSFSGHLIDNNGLVKLGFSLDAGGGDVRVWTDSFKGGANFDPTLSVWQRSGADYTLVAEVDDDSAISAGQTDFDAGVSLQALQAGQYLAVLSASPNYANGNTLSAVFAFDGLPAVPIAAWNQPGYDINANDQKGEFWRVNLTGVTQAAAVPEPASYALTLLGVVALWLSLRARRRD